MQSLNERRGEIRNAAEAAAAATREEEAYDGLDEQEGSALFDEHPPVAVRPSVSQWEAFVDKPQPVLEDEEEDDPRYVTVAPQVQGKGKRRVRSHDDAPEALPRRKVTREGGTQGAESPMGKGKGASQRVSSFGKSALVQRGANVGAQEPLSHSTAFGKMPASFSTDKQTRPTVTPASQGTSMWDDFVTREPQLDGVATEEPGFVLGAPGIGGWR